MLFILLSFVLSTTIPSEADAELARLAHIPSLRVMLEDAIGPENRKRGKGATPSENIFGPAGKASRPIMAPVGRPIPKFVVGNPSVVAQSVAFSSMKAHFERNLEKAANKPS